MNRLKRVVALLLALTLIFSLTACQPAEVAPDSSEAPASESQADGEETDDMAGKTLWLESAPSFTMMMPESNQQKMEVDAPVFAAIKDATNAEIIVQPIPESDFEAKQATAFASNDMPDIMTNTSTDNISQYGSIGMLAAISDYPEEAKDYLAIVNAEDRALATNSRQVNGKTYDFQDLEYYRVPVAPMGQIRADLLTELDIPAPTTWDELYDAMLAIKEAYPDMVGFSSRNGTNYLLGQYAYPLGSGGFTGFDDQNGMYYEPNEDKWVYGPTEESFVAVVEFMRQAYADGLLDPDYAIMSRDQMFEKLSNGTMMFVYDNCSFSGRVYNPALREIDEDAYFDLVAPMENPNGTTRANRYERDWGGGMTISSQLDNVAEAISLINWMYTEEGRMITNFGVEGVHYTMEEYPTIVPEIVEATADAPDHFIGIQGEIGVGLLAFAPYVDESTYRQVSDPTFIEFGDRIQEFTDAGTVQYIVPSPVFTGEEADEVVGLTADVINVFNQEIDAFITGAKDMSEWDAMVAQLNEQGADRIEEIYNAAYDRLR